MARKAWALPTNCKVSAELSITSNVHNPGAASAPGRKASKHLLSATATCQVSPSSPPERPQATSKETESN